MSTLGEEEDSMKSILLIAPPAAGKGTQSKLICDEYNITHISTGDLLRERICKNDDFALNLKEQMESGKLVSDDVILELLSDKLNLINEYVLDGFPRNLNQAKEYDNMLSKLNKKVNYAIYLKIDKEIAQKRIVGRTSCSNCGRVYNDLIEENMPKVSNKCDKCGNTLVKRSDDNVITFEKRYETYIRETEPLLNYYKSKGILYEVDSSLETTKVFEEIKSILGDN